MLYTVTLTLLLIIWVLIAVNFGINRAIASIPFLFIMFILVVFLGWFILNFFWVIVLIWLISYINKSLNPRPKTKKRTYYYYSNTNSRSQYDNFEDFFRQNTGNNRTNYDSGGFYTEDKTKYYKVLGVQKGVSKEELKKVYRNLVKQHHPDRFTSETEEVKQYHENKLKEINEAYEKILKDFS